MASLNFFTRFKILDLNYFLIYAYVYVCGYTHMSAGACEGHRHQLTWSHT